jgi:hypothetical protein
MKKENYLPYVDETAKIERLTVDINNVNIRSQAISDLQIDYGENNIGKLTFLDYENLLEAMPLTYSIIRIEFADLVGMEYRGNFIIIKSDVNRYKDGSARVTVYFESITTYTLKNTYVSKSFKDKTLIEMLQQIFEDYAIPVILAKHESDYIHDYFVFPKNISIWEFLNRYLYKEGYVFFHDRVSLKIFSRKYLEAQNIEIDPVEYNFKYDSSKPHFNILEYQGTISNSGKLNNIATINKNFRSSDLKYDFNIFGINDILEKEQSNGGFMGMSVNSKLKDFYPTIGVKEYDSLENYFIEGSDEDYRDIIRNNNKIKIVIQGINTENLYHRIKVNIGRSKTIDTADMDKTYSGEYIITEVIDKIISGVFVQVLTLQSADYPKGDENVW